jgi:quinol monooxygenase YgiN
MSTNSPKPISFIVRLKFLEEDRAEIDATLTALAAATRQEAGCISYIPHWVEGEPATMVIYEQYRDHAALDAHRASPHFKQYAVGGFYQKMRERAVEDLIAIA